MAANAERDSNLNCTFTATVKISDWARGSALGAAMATVVYYSGMVQGVGFRATAASIAHSYPVSGWVRNLPDGRVEMLVDGPAREVQAFLAAIRQRMASYIDAEETESRELESPLDGFRIVRH